MSEYKYTGELVGKFDTRRDCIGAVTNAVRRHNERRAEHGLEPKTTVEEAIERVIAFKPYLCDYCLSQFLTEEELEEHQPCPTWQYDMGETEVPPV